MKNVLIVGGSGTWSGLTYIPSIIKTSKYVRLVAIMDKVNPYFSCKTVRHYDFLEANNVKWICSSSDCDTALLKDCIITNDIDIVIISTPPKYHLGYTLSALECGVDVICDKPIIATKSQSSCFENAIENIDKHYTLLNAIENSYNKKEKRRSYVLTPLRRKVQDTYTNIYDSIKEIKEKFSQEVSNISISHNDGVFRFSDEIELKCGSHGYAEGFGKLTHTGYHILDVVAGLIEFGSNTNEDITCSCKIINCNTVRDMLNSKSYEVNSKLLANTLEQKEVSDIALGAEMDITICYTLYHGDVKFCNIIVDLIHLGMSNRTLSHYDFNRYNDQGRTNELNLHIQQGSLFSLQMILNTMSQSSGTIGNGYTFKNFHPKVAKRINTKHTEIIDFANQSRETTANILTNMYIMLSKNNLSGYYAYTDFLKQKLTNELYMAALIAKSSGKPYTWKLGKITK